MFLETNTGLKELHLNYNLITGVGGQIIFNLYVRNSCLKILNLS